MEQRVVVVVGYLFRIVKLGVASASENERLLDDLLARKRQEVLECHAVTGEEGFITKVAVPYIEHLEQLIKTLLPFGKPTTSIVLSTSLNHRPLQQP